MSRWRDLRPRSYTPWLVFAGWFVVAFASIAWVYGLRPSVFGAPDEALNRLAGLTIRRTGRPFLELPFPDPEDVAHPRAWYSMNDSVAIPVYPPVSLYFYALFTLLRNPGYVLIIAWPASGIAAFAAGTAQLLPIGRRWLAVFAPALGMPALYWFLRPWMNISVLLAALGWALLAWSRWRATNRTGWLAAALLAVGVGAAVRPDYAAYLLPVALLSSLSASPRAFRPIFAWTLAAGLAAVGVNLVLNHLITGHAFQAAYQLAIAREEGPPSGPRWLNLVEALLVPMGLPTSRTLLGFAFKYWIALPPVVLLLAAQLSLVPLLARKSRPALALQLLAIVFAVFFMCSRMDRGLFGAARPEGMMYDSIPRYWTPVYLFAALPPLLFVGHLQRRLLFGAGVAFVAALAGASSWQVGSQVLRDRHMLMISAAELGVLSGRLPQRAIVYTPVFDKVLWSRFQVADSADPTKTAQSMKRALEHEYPVYLWLPTHPRSAATAPLRALGRRGLELTHVDPVRALYEVKRKPEPN